MMEMARNPSSDAILPDAPGELVFEAEPVVLCAGSFRGGLLPLAGWRLSGSPLANVTILDSTVACACHPRMSLP